MAPSTPCTPPHTHTLLPQLPTQRHASCRKQCLVTPLAPNPGVHGYPSGCHVPAPGQDSNLGMRCSHADVCMAQLHAAPATQEHVPAAHIQAHHCHLPLCGYSHAHSATLNRAWCCLSCSNSFGGWGHHAPVPLKMLHVSPIHPCNICSLGDRAACCLRRTVAAKTHSTWPPGTLGAATKQGAQPPFQQLWGPATHHGSWCSIASSMLPGAQQPSASDCLNQHASLAQLLLSQVAPGCILRHRAHLLQNGDCWQLGDNKLALQQPTTGAATCNLLASAGCCLPCRLLSTKSMTCSTTYVPHG